MYIMVCVAQMVDTVATVGTDAYNGPVKLDRKLKKDRESDTIKRVER